MDTIVYPVSVKKNLLIDFNYMARQKTIEGGKAEIFERMKINNRLFAKQEKVHIKTF